jgi:hypothetical protein
MWRSPSRSGDVVARVGRHGTEAAAEGHERRRLGAVPDRGHATDRERVVAGDVLALERAEQHGERVADHRDAVRRDLDVQPREAVRAGPGAFVEAVSMVPAEHVDGKPAGRPDAAPRQRRPRDGERDERGVE